MLSLSHHGVTWRITCTAAIEMILVAACFAGHSAIRALVQPGWHATLSSILPFALLAAVVSQASLWSFGLYSRRVIYSPQDVFRSLLGALVLASVLLIPVVYLFDLLEPSLPALTLRSHVSLVVLIALALVAERYIVLRLLGPRSDLGRTLILGGGDGTEEVIREVQRDPRSGVDLVGVLARDRGDVGGEIEGVPVLGTLREIEESVEQLDVQTILLSLPCEHEELPLDFLLECRSAGKEIIDISTLYESLSQKMLLEKLEAFASLVPLGGRFSRIHWLAKDAGERALALLLLLLLAGPLLLVYVLLRLHHGGSAIAAEPVVGRGGREILLFRFRTRARASGQGGSGSVGDRFAAWIERTGIDTLPMLFTVLRGELAFVGPRPESLESYRAQEAAVPGCRHRLTAKPGWTGWAQVARRGASSPDAREDLRYDLYYLEHMSFAFDALIVLRALRGLISRRARG